MIQDRPRLLAATVFCCFVVLALVWGWSSHRELHTDVADAPNEPSATSIPGSDEIQAVRSVLLTDKQSSRPEGEFIKGLVRFDGLGSVQVSVRSYPVKMPVLSTTVLHDYDYLVNELETGNGAAGFQLYRALRQCEGSHRTVEDLESAIETLYATRMVVLSNGNRLSVLDEADLRDHETQLRNGYTKCKGLSDEQIVDEPLMWLRESADNGFVPAVDRLSWQLFEGSRRDREKAEMYFQKGWELGAHSALRGLYGIYKNGTGTIDADPVRAAVKCPRSLATWPVRLFSFHVVQSTPFLA